MSAELDFQKAKVLKNIIYQFLGCEEGPGICALIMTLGSLFLIVVSLPLSLMFVVKVVQG